MVQNISDIFFSIKLEYLIKNGSRLNYNINVFRENR